MIERMRTRVVWLAAGLILGGGALSMAAVQVGSIDDGERPEEVVEIGEDVELIDEGGLDDPEVPEPVTEPDVLEVETTGEGDGEDGERPMNHGWYVSRAAKCQPAGDATPPEDCETNGRAHGKYVSGVARSDAGKADAPETEAKAKGKGKAKGKAKRDAA